MPVTLTVPTTKINTHTRAQPTSATSTTNPHPAVVIHSDGQHATRLNNLALVLQDLGQPAAARPPLERALHIDETVHGPDHPAVAIPLSNLAMVLRDLGQPAAARPLAERALRIDETVHGPDHPAVASSLNNLAAVLSALGEPAAARPLAERALRIAETAHGPDHPTVAMLRANLWSLGDGPD
jgi:tetratricopeptide (TPR) repeat protein